MLQKVVRTEPAVVVVGTLGRLSGIQAGLPLLRQQVEESHLHRGGRLEAAACPTSLSSCGEDGIGKRTGRNGGKTDATSQEDL
jgi:hypothetical protein